MFLFHIPLPIRANTVIFQLHKRSQLPPTEHLLCFSQFLISSCQQPKKILHSVVRKVRLQKAQPPKGHQLVKSWYSIWAQVCLILLTLQTGAPPSPNTQWKWLPEPYQRALQMRWHLSRGVRDSYERNASQTEGRASVKALLGVHFVCSQSRLHPAQFGGEYGHHPPANPGSNPCPVSSYQCSCGELTKYLQVSAIR